MSLKDLMREDIKSYGKARASNLENLLCSLVQKNSINVYRDPALLQEEMRSLNASEDDILRILLMVRTPGLQEILNSSCETPQDELNKFVCQAEQKTGLSRARVMDLTKAIAVSAGISFDYTGQYYGIKNNMPREAFVVPVSVYEKELTGLQSEFKKAVETHTLPSLDMGKLDVFVKVGLPLACYYKGYCLLHAGEPGQNSGQAVQLLEEAASQGSAEAAGELGDYYYQRGAGTWGLAYKYYTGFGTLSLTARRKEAVCCMLNQKKYNGRVLVLSAFLLVLMCAALVLAPGAAVFPPYYLAGGIAAACNLAVLALAALLYRARPYGNFYVVPVLMFAVWSLHIAARLLF